MIISIANIMVCLVARSAEQILTSEAPDVLNRALDELSVLAKNPAANITHEKDHPFTECATYADDIKETYGAF